MKSDSLSIEQRGTVTILRLARAPANAIDLDFCKAVASTYDDVLAQSPGAIVITGMDRFFSAGLDLKAVPTYDQKQQQEMLLALNHMLARLYSCPVPLVGAINGHAIAGGFILALVPDYRVGPTGTALFGLTEARAGIPFPAAPLIVLRAELAPQHVRAVTLMARTFGPEEALAMGVVDELCAPEDVLERAIEVATDMATIPGDAYRRIKNQIRTEAIEELERVSRTGADPMSGNWIDPSAVSAAAAVLSGSGRPDPGRR